jgi:hypothetical protein
MAESSAAEMKLTVIASGTHSDDWPEIELWVNDICHGRHTVQDHSEIDFNICLPARNNCVRIDYVNKTESHTKIIDGCVAADQSLELRAVRFDDILCETWMLTDGRYQPRYFEGYLRSFPDAQACLPSQLIWHFPGSFYLPTMPNEEIFWEWYRDQRNTHMTQYQGKDWHREEKYIGSRDLHQDLTSQLKELINV